MKYAAPYEPNLSSPLNSSLILGIAVATMVRSNSVSKLQYLQRGRQRKMIHLLSLGKQEDRRDKSEYNDEQLTARRVLHVV